MVRTAGVGVIGSRGTALGSQGWEVYGMCCRIAVELGREEDEERGVVGKRWGV